MELFGGVEAGGTKFFCVVGDAEGHVKAELTIPTTTTSETLTQVIRFFKNFHEKTPLLAIGIGSFGPLDLNLTSKTFGYITTTPKAGWRDFDFVGTMHNAFPQMPIGFDTDVNAAALGEFTWGAAQGLETFLYVTVGTGIGGGGMINGALIHGAMHPEIGHIFIPHLAEDREFPGVCPFHGNCLEGLASGKAMEKRWQVACATDLPHDHSAWELEAGYLALAISNWILMISPQKIILGGGVMMHDHLFRLIYSRVQKLLNGYINHPLVEESIEQCIVKPALIGYSGVRGAVALAMQAYEDQRRGGYERKIANK